MLQPLAHPGITIDLAQVVAATAEPAAPPFDPHERERALLAEVRGAAPLRRALARVAGRWVASQGWQRLGFARLEDYAAERPGVSARELRDLAHVDAALADLPACEAAFLAGGIGWTSLRLVCRVARPEDEADWAARARSLSARALAREVRAVDRDARVPELGGEQDVPHRGMVMQGITGPTRGRWWFARQLANRTAGRTLRPGEFAEALLGEVLSGFRLEDLFPDETGETDEAEDTAPEPGAAARETGAPAAARAPEPPPSREPPPAELAPPAFLAGLVRDLDAADAFELDARLCRALRLEAGHLARVAAGLARVLAWGLHRDLGFPGLDRYAEERLGISARRARALLRIERAGSVCPALREAFAAGRVSWVQAHTLVPLLLEDHALPHREAWIAHAGRVSVRRLSDDVEAALARGQLAPPPLDPADADPAGVQTGANAWAGNEAPTRRPERGRLFFAAPRDVSHLFRSALAGVQRLLERRHGRPSSQDEALAAMLEHAIETWLAPQRAETARQRREHRIFERDGWRCAVPGCSSHRNLHAHHIDYRSRGGSDADWNQVAMCAWHHLRGVHAGLVRCEGRAPDGLRFELGVRAGAESLSIYTSSEVRERPLELDHA